MNQIKTYTVNEAIKKLEHYCAYQERCHMDVSNKLKKMGMIPLAIDTVINHLIENNFLNEERYAKSFARGKFNIKKWGKQRIIRELKIRDVSKYIITSALKEIPDENYLRSFNILAEKKLSQIHDENSLKRKKKLAEYLLYRGWEPQLVYDKVNELIQ